METADKHLFVAKKLCVETGLIKHSAISIKTDNQAACAMIQRTHGTKCRKIHQLLVSLYPAHYGPNRLQVMHMPTRAQKSDIFTKQLNLVMLARRCHMLNVVQISWPRGSVVVLCTCTGNHTGVLTVLTTYSGCIGSYCLYKTPSVCLEITSKGVYYLSQFPNRPEGVAVSLSGGRTGVL